MNLLTFTLVGAHIWTAAIRLQARSPVQEVIVEEDLDKAWQEAMRNRDTQAIIKIMALREEAARAKVQATAPVVHAISPRVDPWDRLVNPWDILKAIDATPARGTSDEIARALLEILQKATSDTECTFTRKPILVMASGGNVKLRSCDDDGMVVTMAALALKPKNKGGPPNIFVYTLRDLLVWMKQHSGDPQIRERFQLSQVIPLNIGAGPSDCPGFPVGSRVVVKGKTQFWYNEVNEAAKKLHLPLHAQSRKFTNAAQTVLEVVGALRNEGSDLDSPDLHIYKLGPPKKGGCFSAPCEQIAVPVPPCAVGVRVVQSPMAVGGSEFIFSSDELLLLENNDNFEEREAPSECSEFPIGSIVGVATRRVGFLKGGSGYEKARLLKLSLWPWEATNLPSREMFVVVGSLRPESPPESSSANDCIVGVRALDREFIVHGRDLWYASSRDVSSRGAPDQCIPRFAIGTHVSLVNPRMPTLSVIDFVKRLRFSDWYGDDDTCDSRQGPFQVIGSFRAPAAFFAQQRRTLRSTDRDQLAADDDDCVVGIRDRNGQEFLMKGSSIWCPQEGAPDGCGHLPIFTRVGVCGPRLNIRGGPMHAEALGLRKWTRDAYPNRSEQFFTVVAAYKNVAPQPTLNHPEQDSDALANQSHACVVGVSDSQGEEYIVDSDSVWSAMPGHAAPDECKNEGFPIGAGVGVMDPKSTISNKQAVEALALTNFLWQTFPWYPPSNRSTENFLVEVIGSLKHEADCIVGVRIGNDEYIYFSRSLWRPALDVDPNDPQRGAPDACGAPEAPDGFGLGHFVKLVSPSSVPRSFYRWTSAAEALKLAKWRGPFEYLSNTRNLVFEVVGAYENEPNEHGYPLSDGWSVSTQGKPQTKKKLKPKCILGISRIEFQPVQNHESVPSVRRVGYEYVVPSSSVELYA